MPSVLEMVMQSTRLALLPAFITQRYLANGELSRILPKYQGQQWSFYMVHRFQREKSVHISRSYQLIKYYFSNTCTHTLNICN